LETISILGSPIAPFFMDQLFNDLNLVTKRFAVSSVHLADFPKVNKAFINEALEAQMDIAQRTSSLVLGLRKKEKIRVRQPLQKIMVPILDKSFANNILHVKELILSEVNVKELELLEEGNSMLVKSIKPNFKTIGPKYGKQMKAISELVKDFTNDTIAAIESNNGAGEVVNLGSSFEISIGDTARLIANLMGKEVAISLDSQRLRPKDSEVERLFASNQKAKELFGWEPKYSGLEGFKAGLRETIEWFTKPENLNSYKSTIYNT
jgi:isoleucyl-tRNA synthetase